MQVPTRALTVLSTLTSLGASAVEIRQLDSFAGPPSSSEIVAFDRASDLLFNTYGSAGNAGVQIIEAANPKSLTSARLIDLSTLDGLSVGAVSSVAADPLGRGFGVATFIPQQSGSHPGRIVFFDPQAGTVLHSLEVGYHPDMVRFSADGTRLLIANEGEPVSEGAAAPFQHFDRPGSVSIVDLSSIARHTDVAVLGSAQVATYDFSPANLAPGVALDGIRVNPSNRAERHLDLEPEYITERHGKLYVSLQENNALGEFDLDTRQWTAVRSLGTLTQRIDASDRDGGIAINDWIAGMPMPDAIASFTAGGSDFVITANEGDARPPDNVRSGHPLVADDARLSQLGSGGRPALDPATRSHLDSLYGGNALANAALGRLTVSLQDGLDADGEIAEPTMFGTRSFSIWDARSGKRVWDSGSLLEEITANEVPLLFNSDGTDSSFDTRSDNKGPEPEGVTLGEVNGRLWAFIGLERVGGVAIFDVSAPASPTFVDYFNTGELGPEGLEFVSAQDSPLGVPLLFVGYEVGSRVGVYAIVPEAGHLAPGVFGVVILGLGIARQCRRRVRG
ncbi:MAG: choice-of-anchor I family protein [Verrucomicrobiales bacterium]|nr:choice-of-anchor I family protein [Verrucomicrobiales bacterium]